MGDSFLYGLLPLEAKNLGIALPLVGVLLSANRLVRLISNTWASAIFERLGPRTPFILAAVLSLITTALYGVGWGFVVFLLARLGWGIAWSALRQGGYQAVWTGSESARGRLTGLLWGLVRLGSAFSVLAGGYLRDRFGYRAAILFIDRRDGAGDSGRAFDSMAARRRCHAAPAAVQWQRFLAGRVGARRWRRRRGRQLARRRLHGSRI